MVYKRPRCSYHNMADGVDREGVIVSITDTEPEYKDVNLNDRHTKMEENKSFQGATLQMKTDAEDVEFRGAGVDLNRSASQRSQTSTGSGDTSRKETVPLSENSVKSFFSQRQGVFENAVELCREHVKNELDGEIKGAWLLSEIDHWDLEREKLVLLTDHSLKVLNYDYIRLRVLNLKSVTLSNISTVRIGDLAYPRKSIMRIDHWDNEMERIVLLTQYSLLVMHYDFIAVKVLGFKRVLLHLLLRTQIGELIYPKESIMPPREHGGLRIYWGDDKDLSFVQKWNPWSTEIPYLTLSHHPLYYQEGHQTATYSVDDFCSALTQAVGQAYRAKQPGKTLTIDRDPIVIESYASLSSLIFNQSAIGFNKERGGVSF